MSFAFIVRTKYHQEEFADWNMKKPNVKRVDAYAVKAKGESLEEPLF